VKCPCSYMGSLGGLCHHYRNYSKVGAVIHVLARHLSGRG
jgi:hypothetical protein